MKNIEMVIMVTLKILETGFEYVQEKATSYASNLMRKNLVMLVNGKFMISGRQMNLTLKHLILNLFATT